MLKLRSWVCLLALVAIATVGYFALIRFGVIPAESQECKEYGQPPNEYCTPHNTAHFVLWTVGGFLNSWAGAIGAVATVAIAAFTATLWRATDKLMLSAVGQGEAMERSIAEAARAATAMEGVAESMAVNAEKIIETVEINREIAARQKALGEAQLRAYISVLIGDALYQDSNVRFEARPILCNTGSTPARNVRWRIRCAILPVALQPPFRFDLPGPSKGSGFIPQGQSMQMQAVVRDRIPDDDVPNTKAGAGQSLYVWGYVIYEDIFHRTHRTTFAQQIYWRQTGPAGDDGVAHEQVRGTYMHIHNRGN